MPDDIISSGKLVSLTYRIEDEQGHVLEKTDIPVSYIHGGRTELIGGMGAAVSGRCVGDEVELILGPDQGFGSHDPDLTFTDDIENLPPELRFVGAEVQMENELGETRQFQVTRIANGKLTVDGNHPLAGKTLRVHVWIQEVRDPTYDELTAHLGAGCALPGGGLH